MRFYILALTLLSTTLSGCSLFLEKNSGPNATPAYSVNHDFGVFCKWRPGEKYPNGLDVDNLILRIDPTKQGEGKEWDDFKVEVQEKTSSKGNAQWVTQTSTNWLPYPGTLVSQEVYQTSGPARGTLKTSPDEYLLDFRNLLKNRSLFKNGDGFPGLKYRLVLKGKSDHLGKPVISKVTAMVEVNVASHYICDPRLPQEEAGIALQF